MTMLPPPLCSPRVPFARAPIRARLCTRALAAAHGALPAGLEEGFGAVAGGGDAVEDRAVG